uniref:Ribosomal protein S20 n=1 Tax=Ahnfeltia plicata TaxID=28023 RepID=A0A1C9CAV7_9FLOR|nr:ribosomal protein S20 [Ahnfeltia plicata]AOM65521.1 ribosomal protein S20 [Ahnfeltia plicata]UAT97262.1 ribosomal protein S20 [Ahnfeltia plicata]UAT97467.1 ribosomal protein S20 [Ahnfeltia plicata]
MSKNLSATKRTKISIRNRGRNKVYKSNIKTLTKKCLMNIQDLDKCNHEEAKLCLFAVYSKIDKAVKKGVLHKNSAARKKASLAKNVKNAMLMSLNNN